MLVLLPIVAPFPLHRAINRGLAAAAASSIPLAGLITTSPTHVLGAVSSWKISFSLATGH